MVQWWEHGPPTSVSQVYSLTRRHVCWVCCWCSTLLWGIFVWVLWFSPLLKNQHFQIPIQSWNTWAFQMSFLNSWCSVGKTNYKMTLQLHYISLCTYCVLTIYREGILMYYLLTVTVIITSNFLLAILFAPIRPSTCSGCILWCCLLCMKKVPD